MTTIDPSTGSALPPDAIQRVLFVTPKVHVYNIPPLTTTKGYTAANWTVDPKRHIFTARLRILETATTTTTSNSTFTAAAAETVRVDVVLEDPKDGALFAAAPYTTPGAVEQVLDSSRFFAITVVGDGPGGKRKAVLGIGFEERSDAFDFGVTLQEAAKVLSAANEKENSKTRVGGGGGEGGGGRVISGRVKAQAQAQAQDLAKKADYSLKEGETIHVTIGSKGGRRRPGAGAGGGHGQALFGGEKTPETASSTAIPFLLPPPPSAQEVKESQRRDIKPPLQMREESKFDDGEFGEFQ